MTIVGGTRKCKTCIHTHHTQSKNKGKYWSRISCTRNKQRSFTSVFFFLVLVCLVSSHGELSSKGRDAHILSLHGQQSSNFHSFTNCRLQFLQQKLHTHTCKQTHAHWHVNTNDVGEVSPGLNVSFNTQRPRHQLQTPKQGNTPCRVATPSNVMCVASSEKWASRGGGGEGYTPELAGENSSASHFSKRAAFFFGLFLKVASQSLQSGSRHSCCICGELLKEWRMHKHLLRRWDI